MGGKESQVRCASDHRSRLLIFNHLYPAAAVLALPASLFFCSNPPTRHFAKPTFLLQTNCLSASLKKQPRLVFKLRTNRNQPSRRLAPFGKMGAVVSCVKCNFFSQPTLWLIVRPANTLTFVSSRLPDHRKLHHGRRARHCKHLPGHHQRHRVSIRHHHFVPHVPRLQGTTPPHNPAPHGHGLVTSRSARPAFGANSVDEDGREMSGMGIRIAGCWGSAVDALVVKD